MKKFKQIARFGLHDVAYVPSGPIILLFLAALAPAFCMVWLMDNAIRNERLAAREKLAQVYHGQIAFAQERFEASWNELAHQVHQAAALATNRPVQAFARIVQSDLVDSVLLFDESARLVYPNAPRRIAAAASENRSQNAAAWAEANQLEFSGQDYLRAAEKYEVLARTPSDNAAARALQAQVRCLLRAGRKGTALQVITQKLRGGDYDRAVDPDGRCIVANAELLALELAGDRAQPLFHTVEQSLASRLNDYSDSVIAAPQRRFLMKALRALSPSVPLPTLAAEDLAARYAELGVAPPRGQQQVLPSGLPDVWQLPISDRTVALVTTSRLLSNLPPVPEAISPCSHPVAWTRPRWPRFLRGHAFRDGISPSRFPKPAQLEETAA